MSYFFNFQKMAYVKGEKPEGCILCLIRDGSPKVSNLTIHQNALYNASLNLYPYNAGHILLFPTRHVADIRELTPEEESMRRELTCIILDVLDAEYSPAAYNMGYNMGLEAGASIEHLHFHIIPRYPHELGIADLIGGQRVLIENPSDTLLKMQRGLADHPRSDLIT